MARSTYMLKGVSPSTLAARLRQLPAITEQEAAQAASRVCDAAKEVAEREGPSGRISFSVVEYGSDKGEARLLAKGPRLSPVGGGYSVPLATILEYGTGLYGDRSYGGEHRYVVDKSGKGAEGWVYPADHAKGSDGESFRFTHGQHPAYYMRSARIAAASQAARELSRAVDESKRRSGL